MTPSLLVRSGKIVCQANSWYIAESCVISSVQISGVHYFGLPKPEPSDCISLISSNPILAVLHSANWSAYPESRTESSHAKL